MDPSESRSRLRIAALFLLIVAGFYWKLTLTSQFNWMSGPDLAEQVLPWFEEQAREWHAGRVPLCRFCLRHGFVLGAANPERAGIDLWRDLSTTI